MLRTTTNIPTEEQTNGYLLQKSMLDELTLYSVDGATRVFRPFQHDRAARKQGRYQHNKVNMPFEKGKSGFSSPTRVVIVSSQEDVTGVKREDS